MHVLLIEDERNIADVIIAYLEKEGWSVDHTTSGKHALHIFDPVKHQLVLLDLMLEGMNGEEVCTHIRKRSVVPIIMITSKTQEEDAIGGLNLGADDYIFKPFRVKELIARIHALLRRVNILAANSEKSQMIFNRGRLLIDLVTSEVWIDGVRVALTGSEYKLLIVLLETPGKIHSRNDLLYNMTGDRFLGESRVIDTHIKNLRKKIEPEINDPIYILTVVGRGYKFGMQPDDLL